MNFQIKVFQMRKVNQITYYQVFTSIIYETYLSACIRLSFVNRHRARNSHRM